MDFLDKERRNKQDLIEICQIYKGFIKLDIGELFVKDLNVNGSKGHSIKLEKF